MPCLATSGDRSDTRSAGQPGLGVGTGAPDSPSGRRICGELGASSAKARVSAQSIAVIRANFGCMTMLSFRVADDEADEVRRWAQALGVDRSEILRDALHRHLVALRAEDDAAKWVQAPATAAERSLAQVADWGPAEDWADWRDAAR